MNLHAIPNEDGRKHLISEACWCYPTVQEVISDVDGSDHKIIIHNALDARERFERQGFKTKGWIVEQEPT